MRKICVFTSTRAEYGLLRRVIKGIDTCPDLRLQVIVSGTHLVAEQGMTIKEIRADGFEPDECVDINLTDDSPVGICRSMGLALTQYGQVLMRLRPDVLVILGDRFEAFCCAAAAQICRVPIAHIHGGESTEGAVDEAFRHSITKMAHLHFSCCEEYRRRIIQLGESPQFVYNVGALGVENIRNTVLVGRTALEKSIGFLLDKPFFLVTFHPVTLEKATAGEQFAELLVALDQFADHKIIFTKANADTDGKIINGIIDAYVKKHPKRCIAFPSLGLVRYLSAMKLCDAVVGNSSSGILEAPAFKVPTVNIGDRQKGRIRAASVVDCAPDHSTITAAIGNALDPGFQILLANMYNPFEQPGTSCQIVQKLRSTNWSGQLKKSFFDLNMQSASTEILKPLKLLATVRPKRCLIVGFGSIGQRHLDVLDGLGHSTAVVSRHVKGNLLPYPCYSTIEDAMESFNPEYVVICNRTFEHGKTLQSLETLGYSGQCIVEKPVFATTAELPGKLSFDAYVGYQLRFHSLIRQAKEILAGKRLLSIEAYVGQYLPTWRPGTDYRECYSASRQQGGGVLRDLSHELDYIQHLGGVWNKVCAMGGHYSDLEIDSDDQLLLLIELESCPCVSCNMNYLDRTPRRFCSIQYEGGSLWLDFILGRIEHNNWQIVEPQHRNEMFANMHYSLLEDTAEKANLCTLHQARDTLALIEAAEQSLRERKFICRSNP